MKGIGSHFAFHEIFCIIIIEQLLIREYAHSWIGKQLFYHFAFLPFTLKQNRQTMCQIQKIMDSHENPFESNMVLRRSLSYM